LFAALTLLVASSQTFAGRAATLIAGTNEVGQFQKIVNAFVWTRLLVMLSHQILTFSSSRSIGNFLVIISIAFVVIIILVDILLHGMAPLEALKQVVSTAIECRNILRETDFGLGRLLLQIILMIAAIPIGLTTVLSVTMAVGAKQLAAKDVIVKRLPAIEELASVSVLCSDKTGTLTLNQLTFDAPFLPKGKSGKELFGQQELLRDAYLASETGANDAIEKAVRKAAEEDCDELKTRKDAEGEEGGSKHGFPGLTVKAFIPFDPSTKYTWVEAA
jgi:H+-transporting ATPase